MYRNYLFSFCLSFLLHKLVSAEYMCGVGIADITGPIAEINLMGYAKSGQDGAGIHFRLYSRSYVVVDQNRNIIVYSVNDLGMISWIFKKQVIESLNKIFGNLFNDANVMLATTHNHSGPGGYMPYLLYILNAKGFDKQNFNVIVEGIIESITRAIRSKELCEIYFNEGELLEANINRSPTSYNMNPEEERKKYKYNVDKTMSLLKFVATNGRVMGIIAWFPVHATSMNNSNLLVSGDNKGYASMQFEHDMNSGSLPGKGTFVAAFPNSNEGDVSPNTKGAHCINTDEPCDMFASTCRKFEKPTIWNSLLDTNDSAIQSNQHCIAFGPGRDMFQSTQIIGDKQYQKAKELSLNANERVTGAVSFIHQFVDMSNVSLNYNGKTVHTCLAALGNSFAAGTTDGPGAPGFHQGTLNKTVWNFVAGFIKLPTEKMKVCHAPKPILLPTGMMKVPYDWQPRIIPTQIIAIGNVVIVGLPGEFTTMSGRRIRNAVRQELSTIIPNVHIILSGPTNEYASYVATFEEYQAQRYEAASTIFGPHTLEAYKMQFKKLAKSLVNREKLPIGPNPPNVLRKDFSLIPQVLFDDTLPGLKFGDILEDVKSSYRVGNTVSVKFVSANPRNDLMTEKTFLAIELFDQKSKQWVVVATDGNWETKYLWKRSSIIKGQSEATVLWQIPKEAIRGNYRIKVYGVSKNRLGKKLPYTGVSSVFKVE